LKEFDPILDPKLLAHGYLIGEDGEISFDPQTQVKSNVPIYDIQETKIVRTYAVKDKTMTEYGKVVEAEVTNVKRYECLAFPDQFEWLDDNGYLIIEDGDSSYEPITQTRATDPTYDIQVDKIVRTYAVADKSLEDAITAKLADIRRDCQRSIYSYYPIWKQANCGNGLYTSEVETAMTTHIANHLIESNLKESEADEAETVAAVRTVIPDWPIS